MPETNPLEYAMQTGTLNSFWATLQPDVPVVICEHGDRTYGELNANANRIVRLLRAAGLQPGDGIALLCANRAEYVEVLQASQRSGLRLTPVNWHLTAEEAAYVVADCGAKAFFAETRFTAVAVAAAEAADPVVRLAIGGPIPGFDAYAAAIAAHDGADLEDPQLGSTMLYTSGTTGRPKGVHRDMTGKMTDHARAQLDLLLGASAFQPGKDVTLVTGPLYHAAPLTFALGLPLAYGTTVVLMDGWEAEESLRLVQEHRVTHSHMVPTMFHRMLSLPEAVREKYDVSSLRLIWHGAAPCPVPVKQSLIEWLGPIVWEYYGATEGLTTIVNSEDWLARPGTVGRPRDNEIVVRDDDGVALPAGEAGTLFIKAPDDGRFRYYGDETKTATTYDGDYYALGDVGYLDPDGWLFLTDRSTNLIISGGVNIYPAEIEDVLITHPSVGDVAVIGVPNVDWGEEVKAIVEVQPGVVASAALGQELIDFARDRLASFKLPRSVDFTDRLPREDNGKLYKRRLREEYRARAAAL